MSAAPHRVGVFEPDTEPNTDYSTQRAVPNYTDVQPRAEGINQGMNTETAERMVALVRQLPILDQTMERLLDMDYGRGDKRNALLDMARNDSGLCAEMLFLANSGCFAGPKGRAVETVEEAWERIDADPLRTLVASASVNEKVRRKFMDEALWSAYVVHTRAISLSCRILAELQGMAPAECQMYTVAGLMHDIGRVIIMIAADSRNASLMGTTPERMRQVVRDEDEAYGMNHCEVGELLYHRWRFSPIMREGILRHHTPLLADDFSRPGAVIFISHFVAMSDFTGEIIANMLGPRLLARLEMDKDRLEEAMRRYASAVRAEPGHPDESLPPKPAFTTRSPNSHEG